MGSVKRGRLGYFSVEYLSSFCLIFERSCVRGQGRLEEGLPYRIQLGEDLASMSLSDLWDIILGRRHFWWFSTKFALVLLTLA